MVSATLQTIGSDVIRIINGSMTDFYGTGRIGSYCLGPDQEIIFSKYMPKFQIKYGQSSMYDKSFGRSFERTKEKVLEVWFFTARGDVGSGTGLKNTELVEYALEKVDEVLRDNADLVGSAHYVSHGTVDPPSFETTDNGAQVYAGMRPFVFRERY